MSGYDFNDSAAELFESEWRVDPNELQIGHFVSRLDRPWRDSPFPLEGVMIGSEDQRGWFAEHCAWVVIDLLRSRNGFRPPSARAWRPTEARTMPAGTTSESVNLLRNAQLNAETVHEAVDCHEMLYRQAGALIESLQKTGRIDAEQARLGLRQIASSLESNIAAMVWLTRIHHADEHTAEHSINVAILAMGLARSLEWTEEQIEQAGLAGLLHDLGKLKLDSAIVNKPKRLNEEEMEYVKQHSRLGYELLRDDERIHPDVARAVLEHHERPDGNGYPDGKRDYAVLELSKLIAVVNAYDAMTSHWPFRPPISHHDALGVLWRERRCQFDPGMVEQLIQFLGWVTPGIVVRLNNGNFAVVLQTSQEHRLWPVVRLLERDGEHYTGGRRIDLARQDAAGKALKIEEVLPDGAIEADLNVILLAEAVTEEN